MTKDGVVIQYVSGPTAIIGMGGLRLLTDPTFDPPGEYPIGDRTLGKLAGPAIAPAEVGNIDAVLLSHDQHPDNLDKAGRQFLEQVPLVISTQSAHERLGEKVRALPNWEQLELPLPAGSMLRVMGVPAQHGPAGAEAMLGEVTGFVLSGESLPTIYVSGDNASLDVVQTIAERVGQVDIALLFAGGAQLPFAPNTHLSFSSEMTAQAAKILDAARVIPLHFEHWQHFTEGRDTLIKAFERFGIPERLRLLEPGESRVISL